MSNALPSVDFPPAALRRFALVFFGLAFLGVASVYAINRIVDPFGANEWRVVPALIQSSRNKKLSLLDQAQKDTRVLIHGSSRQLRVLPSDVETHLGKRAFNAAVTGGGPQDALALTRYAIEVAKLPVDEVLFGIDLERLSPMNAQQDELLQNPRLLALLPDEVIATRTYPAAFQELTTLRLTRSIKAIYLTMKDAWPPEAYSFDADGARNNLKAERALAAGKYDFQAEFNHTVKRYREIYADYSHFDPKDIRALELFFDYCDEHKIRLWLYLASSHPELVKIIESETEQAKRRREFIEYITPIAKARGYVFKDFTDISSFDGEAADYYDGSHPTDANTKRMLKALFGGG